MIFKPEPFPKSKSPGGGRGSGLPEWDTAYLAFSDWFVTNQNLIYLDRHTKFGHDLTNYEPIDITQFHVWLYDKTDGAKRNPSDLVNYLHKIRHLAIVLRDDPDLIMNAAESFVINAYSYKE